jgi:hypothetical protein
MLDRGDRRYHNMRTLLSDRFIVIKHEPFLYDVWYK